MCPPVLSNYPTSHAGRIPPRLSPSPSPLTHRYHPQGPFLWSKLQGSRSLTPNAPMPLHLAQSPPPSVKTNSPVSASPRLSSAMCCVLHVHTPFLPPSAVLVLVLSPSPSPLDLMKPLSLPSWTRARLMAAGRWKHTHAHVNSAHSVGGRGLKGGYARHPCLSGAHAGPAAAQRRRRGWGLLCLSCSLPAVHARAGQRVPELRPSARTLPAAPARLLPPPLGALDVARSRLQAHSASSAGWAELLPQLTTQAPLPASAPGGAAVRMKPPRAFSALPNPSKAVRHFAPSWFTIVMGTGTVGVLIGVLPQ